MDPGTPPGLAPALLALGLASGLHCLGMCGGLVAAFTAAPRTVTLHDARGRREWPRQLAFNAGRIASYSGAGAIAGALGAAGAMLGGALGLQVALFAAANLMLVLVGLHLAGIGAPLARLEALGAPLWRRLAPAASRLAGSRSMTSALAAGALWGWLPCSLVYGALVTATLAGSVEGGAVAMAAFGLGTLPWLLAGGVGAARLRTWIGSARWRLGAGVLVLGWGAFGLARASGLADAIQRGVLCL